jgi:hypothetical protein
MTLLWCCGVAQTMLKTLCGRLRKLYGVTMTNDESYRMMEALRRYLQVSLYDFDNKIEVVLKFKTEDGKVHQLCNSFVEKQR